MNCIASPSNDTAYDAAPCEPVVIGSDAHKLPVRVELAELLEVCLAENERRLSIYDSRLLRPLTVPALVRLARHFLGVTQRQFPA